jgi:hypothetical protein
MRGEVSARPERSVFEVVRSGPDPLELRLTNVVLLGECTGKRRPFSLRFRGPRIPTLAQATYRLVHAEMGELEIFLVPIASDWDATTYEAVFS